MGQRNNLLIFTVIGGLTLIIVGVVLYGFKLRKNVQTTNQTSDESTLNEGIDANDASNITDSEAQIQYVSYSGFFSSSNGNNVKLIFEENEIEVELPGEIQIVCVDAHLEDISFSDEPVVVKQELANTSEFLEKLKEGDYISITNFKEDESQFDPAVLSLTVNNTVCER